MTHTNVFQDSSACVPWRSACMSVRTNHSTFHTINRHRIHNLHSSPCTTLHHTAPHCNTLQHTAILCYTLQHTYHSTFHTINPHRIHNLALFALLAWPRKKSQFVTKQNNDLFVRLKKTQKPAILSLEKVILVRSWLFLKEKFSTGCVTVHEISNNTLLLQIPPVHILVIVGAEHQTSKSKCIYIYIYVYTHICIHTDRYTYIDTSIQIQICIHIYMYIWQRRPRHTKRDLLKRDLCSISYLQGGEDS